MTVKAIMKTTITALVLGTLMISNSYGEDFGQGFYERIAKNAIEQIVIQRFNGGYYGRGAGIAIDGIFSGNGDFLPEGRWIVRGQRGSNCPTRRSYGRPDCY